MEDYCIRYANYSDIPSIMNFIDEYWRKNHILSRDRGLFEWQYVDDGKLNMILGEDENGGVAAILGFIPYDKVDTKDFSLALWKAKPGTAFLGIKLLLFLLKNEPHRNMFCNGINVKTSAGIYHRLGIATGELSQWYRLAKGVKYRIACVEDDTVPEVTAEDGYSFEEMQREHVISEEDYEQISNPNVTPYKSYAYFVKRYINHPTYEYLVYKVIHSEVVKAIIVFRIQDCNDSHALRLIDYIGDYSVLYRLTSLIDELVKSLRTEYVDIYEKGLDDSELSASGWIKVGTNNNIIPNYFSPYTKCNVPISISTSDDNIVLFNVDGDQDRPN